MAQLAPWQRSGESGDVGAYERVVPARIRASQQLKCQVALRLKISPIQRQRIGTKSPAFQSGQQVDQTADRVVGMSKEVGHSRVANVTTGLPHQGLQDLGGLGSHAQSSVLRRFGRHYMLEGNLVSDFAESPCNFFQNREGESVYFIRARLPPD